MQQWIPFLLPVGQIYSKENNQKAEQLKKCNRFAGV